MPPQPKEQSTTQEWPPPRERWFPGYTGHTDGWVRSYAGQTIFCGGRRATREEVEETYARKKKIIDERRSLSSREPSYREVLSEFLTACEHRVRTGKPKRMSPRTLHNYTVVLNQYGQHIGGATPFSQTNRPELFTSFGRKFGGWRSSGFDSVVTRLGALYHWAVEMEYIDKYRPGPQFQRPPKSELRDERIDLSKSFTAGEFAKLYVAANATERCWLGLGLFAAMNNSEVAHLGRSVTDLDAGVIDFRRRKTGRVRRVCPLPELVCADLRAYLRPEPKDGADPDLFFISEYGNPYGRTRKLDGKPSDSMSRLFRELMRRADVEHKEGRNFSGLRTTFYNLAPRGEWELERKIVMGRAQGTIDLDSYLEDVGLDRVRHVVAHVWNQVSTSLADEGVSVSSSAFASPPAHAGASAPGSSAPAGSPPQDPPA